MIITFTKMLNYGRPQDLCYSAFVSRACTLYPWTCWIWVYANQSPAPLCDLLLQPKADLVLRSGSQPRQAALAWKPRLSESVPATRQIWVFHTSCKNAPLAEFSGSLFRWQLLAEFFLTWYFAGGSGVDRWKIIQQIQNKKL